MIYLNIYSVAKCPHDVRSTCSKKISSLINSEKPHVLFPKLPHIEMFMELIYSHTMTTAISKQD